MELTSFTELRNTREKLQRLERHHERASRAPAESAYGRELSLKSMRMAIKQLKEEIARFEARANLSDPAEPSKLTEPSIPGAL